MDSKSTQKLLNVHPKLSEKVTQLIAVLTNLGMDARVTQGVRTFSEQDALYAQGRSRPGDIVTNARGGQSLHNYGFATDLAPYRNGVPDWENASAFAVIGKEAKKLDLEWGGDWSKFKDRPHVQLRGMSLKECQQSYRQGNLKQVWKRMEEILAGAEPQSFVPMPDDLLEFGDKGAEVKKLQQQLAALNLLHPHEIDSDFGKITKRAVIGFQRQAGLTADGIVGKGSLAKLTAAIESKNSVGKIARKAEEPLSDHVPAPEDKSSQENQAEQKSEPIQIPQVAAETQKKTPVPGIKASAAAAVAFLTTTGGGIFAIFKELQQEIVYGFFGAAAIIGVVFIIMRFWYANRENDREALAQENREKRAHEIQMATIQSAMRKDLNAVEIVPQPIENSDPQ